MDVDRDFDQAFSHGSSIILQNTIATSASRVGPNQRPVPYDYVRDVRPILDKAAGLGLRVYASIGLANVLPFVPNDLFFEVEYPQLVHAQAAPAAARLFNLGFRRGNPRSYLQKWFLSLPGLDFLRNQYFHPVLDITHPDVVRFGMESVVLFPWRFGDRITCLVGGEGIAGVTPGDRPPPCVRITNRAECDGCRPITHYSRDMTRGFRAWLTDRYGDDRGLRASWKNARVTIATVDPESIDYCSRGLWQAVADYREYLDLLHRQVSRRLYEAGKSLLPPARLPITSFGTLGMQYAWLGSDLACTLSWYARANERRFHDGELYHIGAVARMSGKPFVAAISSPPGKPRGCDKPRPVPPAYQPRCVTLEDTDLRFRDVLTATTVHIGYYKAAVWGVNGGQGESHYNRAPVHGQGHVLGHHRRRAARPDLQPQPRLRRQPGDQHQQPAERRAGRARDGPQLGRAALQRPGRRVPDSRHPERPEPARAVGDPAVGVARPRRQPARSRVQPAADAQTGR